MNEIPTIFERDKNNPNLVVNRWNMEAYWVFDGYCERVYTVPGNKTIYNAPACFYCLSVWFLNHPGVDDLVWVFRDRMAKISASDFGLPVHSL